MSGLIERIQTRDELDALKSVAESVQRKAEEKEHADYLKELEKRRKIARRRFNNLLLPIFQDVAKVKRVSLRRTPTEDNRSGFKITEDKHNSRVTGTLSWEVGQYVRGFSLGVDEHGEVDGGAVFGKHNFQILKSKKERIRLLDKVIDVVIKGNGEDFGHSSSYIEPPWEGNPNWRGERP